MNSRYQYLSVWIFNKEDSYIKQIHCTGRLTLLLIEFFKPTRAWFHNYLHNNSTSRMLQTS